MSLRVLVCDDEPIAVSRLTSLLSRVDGVETVGSASDGSACLEAITTLRPDLVLLDIEMPGTDGFDVAQALERLEPAAAPLVTFVTAYRRFAPEAFDSGAADFLSKPVRLVRLQASIDRARRLLAGREAERRLAALEATVAELRRSRERESNTHVWVHRRGEVMRVELDDIDRASAEGPYVRLHVDDRTHLHREPIGSIEARLDPERHLRAHRSHIVRIGKVAMIRRTFHGASELVMHNGDRIPVGRSYAKEVRRRLLNRGGEQ